MIIWVDAQLSPAIARWITKTFGIQALALRDMGLRDAEDPEIFERARAEEIIFMTKDSDFIDLVCRLGAPPRILWLTCGNVTNRSLRQLLTATLAEAIQQMDQGEVIVEISNLG